MSNDRLVLPPPNLPSLAGTDSGATSKRSFVSRAGHKLEAALVAFGLNVTGSACADLGANVGGFTDCLLQYGAAKIYSVDTGYGVLAWTLRTNPQVVVMERTNALHVRLPEPVTLVAVDVGWTRQKKILPMAAKLLPSINPDGALGGEVLTLIKPHYESDLARTQRGVLTAAQSEEMLWRVVDQILATGGENEGIPWRWKSMGIVQSPLEGQKGNIEYLAWLRREPTTASLGGSC